MAQEQETLEKDKRVLDIMLEKGRLSLTETRSYLSKYLFTGDEVFTPVGDLSYGERVRLSLACLVVQGCNLLILDEPVNHLDIPSRERFEQALAEFQGTVLAVVHDRAFIRNFAKTVWKMENGMITSFIKLDME
jgi:ATP-binding cassette subfamily F protein 3